MYYRKTEKVNPVSKKLIISIFHHLIQSDMISKMSIITHILSFELLKLKLYSSESNDFTLVLKTFSSISFQIFSNSTEKNTRVHRKIMILKILYLQEFDKTNKIFFLKIFDTTWILCFACVEINSDLIIRQ